MPISMTAALLILTFFLNLASAQEDVRIAGLAKINDGDKKITLTTRDLQLSLFLSEYEPFLQEYQDKRDPLRELVWEELIYLEAKKVLNQEASSGEVKTYSTAFKKKLAADKLWIGFQFSDTEIQTAVQRRITARRLFTLKMGEKASIFVSPEEIESYYVQNRSQLGQRPISEVQEKIRSGLQTLKAQDRFRDWSNAITRTHGVFYFSGYKIK